MFNIGPGEMMLLGMLALLLFGPKKLPELGKALGEGLAAFRQSSRGVADEFRRQLEAESKQEDSKHEEVASDDEEWHDEPEEVAERPDTGARPMTASRLPVEEETEEHVPVS